MDVTVQLIDNKICFYNGRPEEAECLIGEVRLDELFRTVEADNDDVLYQAILLDLSSGLFLLPIRELCLSERATNCLLRQDVLYIGDLVQRTALELLRIPNFGQRCLEDVNHSLNLLGLRLSTFVPDWESKRPKIDDRNKRKLKPSLNL